MQAIGADRALPESDTPVSGQWRLRLFAVIASLCLHIVLVMAALRYGEFDFTADTPVSLSIGLVADNPLLAEAVPVEVEATSVPDSRPPASVQETTQSETNQEAEQQVTQEALAENVASAESLDVVEELIDATSPEPTRSAPLVQPPSINSILTTVSRNQEEQQAAAREWANTCTELQRVAGVLGCQRQQQPDYPAVEQAPEAQSVYEFHNPPNELTRTQRSLPTIAGNTGLLAANLAMADIPQGLSDQIMAEVEAGISLYSNRGNPALTVMDRMVDQSAAAQIAREMNSPWVQFQRQQQSLRRYSNRQDAQKAQSCGSIVMLVLKPTEIGDCVSRGNIPLLTVPLQILLRPQ